MRQVEHAFVRVPDKELLAGERDYDGGRGVGRGVNPHVIFKSLVLYFLEHCREVVVSSLGSNPCLGAERRLRLPPNHRTLLLELSKSLAGIR